MQNLISALARIEPLSQGQEEAILALQPFMKHISLKKGNYLYRSGQIPDFVAHVECGILRHVIMDSNENEKILRFFQEDDFIEDCKSFNEQCPVNYSIQALEDCDLGYFKFMDVVHLYTDYPEFEKIGRKMMERNAASYELHLSALMKYNSEERYKFLLQTNPDLIKRISVTHLAQYLDMNRVTLSKMRAKMINSQIL